MESERNRWNGDRAVYMVTRIRRLVIHEEQGHVIEEDQ